MEVYITSAVRTPIGSFCGSLSSFKAHELGGIVIKEAVQRSKIENNEVCEVIMGQGLLAGQGQNPARQASILAGLPYTTPAYNVSMLCGSGLKAVVLGYQSISNGDTDVIVAGGQEVMSQAPHVINLRSGVKLGNGELVDSMLKDGLVDAFHNMHMGETAEEVAKQFQISRSEQDEFAIQSQARTEVAQRTNKFVNEIIPVEITIKKELKIIKQDEYPRPDTSIEGLTKLKPVFVKEGGTVTSGNASGINDGAAAVVLMSKDLVASKGITPLAKIVGFAQSGLDPKLMGLGPVQAVQKLLKKVGWNKDEVDLFELNEAFAAQAVAVNKQLGVDCEKVNVNGGAISLGHPIGASGARVLVTLIYALQERKLRRGIASLCIGGGMGIALAIETCLI